MYTTGELTILRLDLRGLYPPLLEQKRNIPS